MTKLRLTPKTHKGKNKIAEAGNPDFWLVIRGPMRYTIFSESLCYLVEPDGAPGLSRWILVENDTDFTIEEIK